MEINSDQVLNKMTSLRSYFCAQRNKEQTSRTSGAGTSEVFKSSWKFMRYLEFLKDSVVLRKSSSNLGIQSKNEIMGLDNSNNSISIALSASTKTSKKARENALEATNNVMNARLKSLSKPQEETKPSYIKTADESFCNMLANILKDIPEGESKDILKLNMHKAVLDVKYKRSQVTSSDFK